MLTAMWQAAVPLATGPLAQFALLLAITCAVITLVLMFLRGLIRWADARVEHGIQAALATEADDWGEPSREAVERLYGPAARWGTVSETPIYDATIAHIAHHEAVDIDAEWAAICEATGGAA